MERKCKITVLKRDFYEDLAEKYLIEPENRHPNDNGPCHLYHEGQEFVVDISNFFTMLDGKFCSEAWNCISKYVYTALQGGTFFDGVTKADNKLVLCCLDGIRPVTFLLEQIIEE